jgi:hypothetical protein
MSSRLTTDIVGGENAFYSLRHRFRSPTTQGRSEAVNPGWGRSNYHRSLVERISIVRRMDAHERRKDLVYVEQVVNVLNDLAEVIDLRFVDHRKILAKFHLAIIRDVFILEPYVYHQVIFCGRGRWGLRVMQLGEIARKYNDMNPIHRRGVYFVKDSQHDDDYGPIYSRPMSPVLPAYKVFWLLRRRLFGYPTITERGKRGQNKYIGQLEEDTRHLR